MLSSKQTASISFDRPTLLGNELVYIQEALASHQLVSSGPFTRRCERLLTDYAQGSHVLLTNSATAALEIMALALDLKPGDEIIMPSYAYVSCANAFLLRGVRPVFVDITMPNLHIDVQAVESAIGPKTKAILGLHYGGNPCDIAKLSEIAQKNDIFLLEDCAQAFASYSGPSPLGTFGSMACLSFNSKKPIHCSQGGALIINDEALVNKVIDIVNRGTNRADFEKKKVAFYEWTSLASSATISELSAAFLLSQLESSQTIVQKYKTLYSRYIERLMPLESSGNLRLPQTTTGDNLNGSLIFALTERRDELQKYLFDFGISTQFHFVPLHSSRAGIAHNLRQSLPVTEAAAKQMLRLPIFFDLEIESVDRVCDRIFDFY